MASTAQKMAAVTTGAPVVAAPVDPAGATADKPNGNGQNKPKPRKAVQNALTAWADAEWTLRRGRTEAGYREAANALSALQAASDATPSETATLSIDNVSRTWTGRQWLACIRGEQVSIGKLVGAARTRLSK